ncbi:MAG: hypothetical protein JWO71_1104 [Candidatus Acidoferrum typicum]|nr:hypothetical protein [Candidatus Acidoferrum typicum]
MDQCSEWYTRKRSRLLAFWVVGNLVLIAVAFSLNWKFGVAWTVLAVLGFIVGEKLLLRRVDDAAPR